MGHGLQLEVTMARRNHTSDARNGDENGAKQTFSFTAPAAVWVELVGDFTQWQKQAIGMRKDADGVWRATVQLAPGEHYYRFLVDGQWREGPQCALRVPKPPQRSELRSPGRLRL